MVAIHKRAYLFNFTVTGLIMASWLPSADTIKAPTLKNPDQLSSISHFSRLLYNLP